MGVMLSLLLVALLGTLACAQPAPDPQKPDTTGTPEHQASARQTRDDRVCQIVLSTAAAPSQTGPLCDNYRGVPGVVSLAKCRTRQGTLTFQPRLSGGDATSILARPLLCTPEESLGVLNGQPRVQSFVPGTLTCPVGACALEFRIEAAEEAQGVTLTVVYTYE